MLFRITQLYTRWQLGAEIHDSLPQSLKNIGIIRFNDHHALRLNKEILIEIFSTFLDNAYEIQVTIITLIHLLL